MPNPPFEVALTSYLKRGKVRPDSGLKGGKVDDDRLGRGVWIAGGQNARALN